MVHPSFQALADAAAYCEKHGVPFGWITAKGSGYVLREPKKAKAKAKSKPAKKKRKPRPRRPRANDAANLKACKAKTPEQRRARPALWAYHRKDLQVIAQAEAQAAADYHSKADDNAARCKRERKAVAEGCKGRRTANTSAYRAARDEAHRHRTEDWKRYRKRTCGEETAATRHGSRESDSLVRGALPRSMHAAWDASASLYPVSWGMDRRLEKFQEDIAAERRHTSGAHENLSFEEVEALEQSDEDLREAEARWYEQQQDDEIPF